jgi:PHD/YefM family antitoxin component YafN of YafNO toxin-antitoxin module
MIMDKVFELSSIEYITTPEGRPKSVVLSLEDWKKVIETLKIMSNKELIQSIRRAKKQLSKGTKLLSFEEVLENL